MSQKILYVDMDNVLVDFQSGIDHCDQATLDAYTDRLDEVPGIFGKMVPLENAIDAYLKLARHFDTYILSTSPWENESALVDKLRWVKQHLGDAAYKRLIISHNKHLNKGDFLIDDRTKNGAGEFEGEHIHFGTEQFPHWQAVVDYLMGRITG